MSSSPNKWKIYTNEGWLELSVVLAFHPLISESTQRILPSQQVGCISPWVVNIPSLFSLWNGLPSSRGVNWMQNQLRAHPAVFFGMVDVLYPQISHCALLTALCTRHDTAGMEWCHPFRVKNSDGMKCQASCQSSTFLSLAMPFFRPLGLDHFQPEYLAVRCTKQRYYSQWLRVSSISSLPLS